MTGFDPVAGAVPGTAAADDFPAVAPGTAAGGASGLTPDTFEDNSSGKASGPLSGATVPQAPPALKVEALGAGYGGSDVFSGVSFALPPGECVALLGRNGVGKTTLLHSLFNIGPQRHGRIWLQGQDITDEPGHRIARRGMALVPQGRGSFPDLTVMQNLTLAHGRARQDAKPAQHAETGSRSGAGAGAGAGAGSGSGSGSGASLGAGAGSGSGIVTPTVDMVLARFPRLAERRRTLTANLSGGERQLLLVARAMLSGAPVLLLDEPTEGLAPRFIVESLQPALQQLVDAGHTLLIAEQNIALAMALAPRVLVLAERQLVFDGPRETLAAQPEILQQYLGLS